MSKSESLPEESSVNLELLFLAENFLQLHFAEAMTEHRGSMSPTEADSGEDREILGNMSIESGTGFREWLNSPEGKAIMVHYIATHTEDQIIHFVDMEKIEELYIEYKNRTLH